MTIAPLPPDVLISNVFLLNNHHDTADTPFVLGAEGVTLKCAVIEHSRFS